MANVYAARKRLLVGDEWRQPGDLVPEAAGWRNLHSYLSSGAIVLVQTDVEKAYGMNQRIPTDTQLDPLTARVGATHHDQHAGWGQEVVLAEPSITDFSPKTGDCDTVVTFTGVAMDQFETPPTYVGFFSDSGQAIGTMGYVENLTATSFDVPMNLVMIDGLCYHPSGAVYYVKVSGGEDGSGEVIWEDTTTPFVINTYPRNPTIPATRYADAPEITAEDQENADKLTGLGFVAEPQTPWFYPEQNECIISGAVTSMFKFYWDGTAWIFGWSPDPAGTRTAERPEFPGIPKKTQAKKAPVKATSKVRVSRTTKEKS